MVLIVSATEGIKPQTKEVLNLIKEFKLPLIVAINKIDLPSADVEEVEEELVDFGVDLEPYGGKVPVVHISAKTGQNCDLLVEFLIEEGRNLNLQADFSN